MSIILPALDCPDSLLVRMGVIRSGTMVYKCFSRVQKTLAEAMSSILGEYLFFTLHHPSSIFPFPPETIFATLPQVKPHVSSPQKRNPASYLPPPPQRPTHSTPPRQKPLQNTSSSPRPPTTTPVTKNLRPRRHHEPLLPI